MIKESIDIEEALSLLRKRKTTVDDVCKFLYRDINLYQDSREDFHLEEFKKEFRREKNSSIKDLAEEYSETLLHRIQKDVDAFAAKYIDNSINCVLDAMNEKRIKVKKHSNLLLVLLGTIKEQIKGS